MTERPDAHTERLTPGASTSAAGAQPARAAGRLARTRSNGNYKPVLAGAVVLALLLIFIFENTQRVKVSYLGESGHLPLGVALLLAAVAGVLMLGIAVLVRRVQQRRSARRRS
jgi:uncharacterized integral membrane protein